MDFELVAIALGDVTWILLAFCLGLFAKFLSLPPLVGFLATGFILGAFGITSGDTLNKLADLGITLLLFSVGLKLDLKSLFRPQIWAVTALHVSAVLTIFGAVTLVFVALKFPLFESLDWKTALLIAFAMSFSSTVFVVKVLEDKGGMKSLYGRVAIGILIMQDLLAVGFLAASSGKIPSVAALGLLLLIPLRPVLWQLLVRSGHGELLILLGLVFALGGAELFELVGVKGDLGALIMGVLISAHPKSSELAKAMFGFKNLFLIGFFLSIGLSGSLSLPALEVALIFLCLLSVKSGLFYVLMTRFRLRARTSFIATLNLSNYSEFGLIVIAIGVSNGWLESDWLVAMALLVSLSFVVSAAVNTRDNQLYHRFHDFLIRFQDSKRIEGDQILETSGTRIAVFGMGRVGSGAYDRMVERYGESVIGFDADAVNVTNQQKEGRRVLQGDPSDEDFWEKLEKNYTFDLVMLALPGHRASVEAIRQLKAINFQGRIAATAKYTDEEKLLLKEGANHVFNFYREAGVGFANEISLPPDK